jgi:hypothetical protein
MARDELSVFDVPVEGAGNRSLAPLPVLRYNPSMPSTLAGAMGAIHVVHSIPGRVRLRVPILKSARHVARGLEALLSIQPGVIEATANTGCHSLTVVYEPAVWTPESLCRLLQDRSLEELEEYASASLAEDAAGQPSMNWLQPWRFLNATDRSSGSKGELQTGQPVKSGYWTLGYYSMIIGAVLVPVPLVPGIPFLIFSSYCFAKATKWKEADKCEATEQLPEVKEKESVL